MLTHIGTFAKPHHPALKPKFCKRANFADTPNEENMLKTFKFFSLIILETFVILTTMSRNKIQDANRKLGRLYKTT